MTDPTARPKRRWYTEQEAGIGGWLLLFVGGQILAVGALAWHLPEMWHTVAVSGASLAARSDPTYPYVVFEELVGMAARALLFLIGLMMIFRRDPRTPTFYQFALAFVAVVSLTDLLLSERFHHIFHAYKVAHELSTTASDAAHDRAQMATIRLIGFAAVWCRYWRVSERVRLTFPPRSTTTEIPKTP